MAFDLENKITWKELAPSLQFLFKTLQQQITKNANDIENLMNRMDKAEDRLDKHDSQISYLYSISQKFEIMGEKNGYPIGINTINMEDGTQLITQYWVERHYTSGAENPEMGFTIVYPKPMDKILTIQVEDSYYSTTSRGLGWIDGEWWIKSDTINGAGFSIHYDSVHEVNDNHTFQFYCMVTGYVLTGEAPKPPEVDTGSGGSGGDTGSSLDDRLDDIINQLNSMVEIGTIRYAYTVPTNWIELNGQLLSRSEYTDLYNYSVSNRLIVSESEWSNNNQGKFSYGDGSTNFRVPDFRGKFIRSLDSGSGIDSGRVLGTYQMDAMQQITGTFPGNDNGGFPAPTGAFYHSYNKSYGPHDEDGSVCGIWGFDSSRVARSSNETRPKNISLIAIMRAK